jgi:hypothetical protein
LSGPVGDFCTGRHASVTVGSYESEVAEIEYAGIPQGLPLSPLLYVFYNADLVEKPIDGQGGSSVLFTPGDQRYKTSPNETALP